MKNLLLSALALLISVHSFAQTEVAPPSPAVEMINPDATSIQPPQRARGDIYYAGFSGGMMIHTGYISGGNMSFSVPNDKTDDPNDFKDQPIGVSGTPVGFGGIAQIHIGDHLRIGGEGHISTLKYGSGRGSKRNQSHARISWGGVMVNYSWEIAPKWTAYAGTTIGGGNFKNITLFHPTPPDNEIDIASYRNYSFMVLSPLAGIELSISQNLRLNLKTDWMLKLTNHQHDFASGPRLYFGLSFHRKSK
jgi:opacity protein-like surface antigen